MMNTNKLKEIREGKNISQAELAQLVGLTVASITRIETGKTKSPQYKTRRDIARALEVKVSDIWGER